MESSRLWLVSGDYGKEARINHRKGYRIVSVAVSVVLNSGRIISIKLVAREEELEK